MNDPDLPARLRRLVDRYYRGSVNAAAKDWRVPQPSLKRMVDGSVKRPGAEALLRIANRHGTTVEWLLTGEGGPDPIEARPFPVVERERWESTVRDLNLPSEVEKAVQLMPGAIQVAYQVLCWEGLNPTGHRGVLSGAQNAFEGMWEGQGLEYMAWERMLNGLIDAYGRDAVREKLIGELPLAQLGFQAFATWLAETEILPKNVSEKYAEYAPASRPGTRTDRKQVRQVPPLELSRHSTDVDNRAKSRGDGG